MAARGGPASEGGIEIFKSAHCFMDDHAKNSLQSSFTRVVSHISLLPKVNLSGWGHMQHLSMCGRI